MWRVIKKEATNVVELQEKAIVAKKEWAQTSVGTDSQLFITKFGDNEESVRGLFNEMEKAQKRISENLDLGPEFRMVFTTFEGYPSILERVKSRKLYTIRCIYRFIDAGI
jgi:hypothetical protein